MESRTYQKLFLWGFPYSLSFPVFSSLIQVSKACWRSLTMKAVTCTPKPSTFMGVFLIWGKLFLFLGFSGARWLSFSGIRNALTKSLHFSHWNSADIKDFSWLSSMHVGYPHPSCCKPTALPVWKCSVTHFSLLWQKEVPGHALYRWPLLPNKECPIIYSAWQP